MKLPIRSPSLIFSAGFAAISAANLWGAPTAGSDRDALRRATAAAVEQAIAPPVAPGPAVRLLGTSLEGNRITLNFSRELLDYGLGSLEFERFQRLAHRSAVDQLASELASIEFETRIEGVPLERWFELAGRSAPPIATDPAPITPAGGTTAPALAGRRIALSPGHGYYLNPSNAWVLQRDFFQGIVEDFVNHDFVTLLNDQLVAAGVDVRPTRNLNRNAGPGQSGFPRWQEAARYHIQDLGAPQVTVWGEPGFTHLEQDIRCRPLYANYVAADLLVSLHNNGGGGTGTETLYDNANSAAAESKRLADTLHAKVIAAIRRDYNANWTDRRVQGFNGSYGENRLATRPAVIIEIAFMDRPTPDNAAIQDDRFRRIVATAIAEGLAEFTGGAVPATPDRLFAYADPTDLAITLSWTDRADNELSYRVERSFSPGENWTTLATLPANTTSYRDTNLSFGQTCYYRVWAVNAAGPSAQASNETVATAKLASTTLAFDIVSPTGITANWDQDFGISFTVVDGFGAAVRRATVTIFDAFNSNYDQVRTDDTGRFLYLRRVPHGQTPGAYQFDFQVMKEGYTTSPTLSRTIQVNNQFAASGSPTIARQPHAVTATVGTSATLSVAAIGAATFAIFPAYQWQRNGVSIAGATNADYTIANVSAADAGNYQVVVRNTNGPVTSLAVALTVQPMAWLTNLSTRVTLASAQTLIVGFSADGGFRDILVRAAGPALASFGLTNAMPDPRIDAYTGMTRLTANNDWLLDLAPVFSEVGAFPFAVPSRDAALRWNLLGSQTIQVSGSPGGVVLVEAYDTGTGGSGRLVNLSARNRVGTGTDVLIAGFYVNGTGTKRLLVRAVGPTLSTLGVPGVLADPVLEVRNGTTVIATNDNWDASLAATFTQAGAFPLTTGSRDAALVVTLNAGAGYTVQVSGVNNTSGEALIEIYELP